MELTDATRLRLLDEEVAAKVFNGEAVLIHLATGVYYSLDGAGARAFELLHDGHPIGAVGRALAQEYAAPPAACAEDLRGLADALMAEGLMVAADGAGPTEAPLSVPPVGPYAPLELRSFRDMADLIALDPPIFRNDLPAD